MKNKIQIHGLNDFIRASEVERLLACPKSWSLSGEIPDKPTADSERGTALHGYIENFLKYGEKQRNPLKPEDVEGVEWLVGEVSNIIDFAKRVKSDVFFEERFFYADLFAGKPDLFIKYGDGTADIIDYKFGVQPVTQAQDNKQLATYAVILKKNFPEITSFNVHIFQPFAIGGARETHGLLTDRDVAVFEKELLQLAKVVFKENAPLAKNTGEYCQFCKAREICPLTQKSFVEIAHGENTGELSTISPDQITLSNALKAAQMIEKYKKARTQADRLCEALEAKIVALAQELGGIEGLEIKTGARRESWNAWELSRAIVKDKLLTEHQAWECASLSKSTLINKIAEEVVCSKAEATRHFERAVIGLDSTVSFNKPTIKVLKK